MQGIKDKVIIVTGAGRNIGQVYSRRLAEEGAKVVVCDVIDCEETAGSSARRARRCCRCTST